MENDRRVDVVYTPEQVEARTQRGWWLVRTFTDTGWADAANNYAV
jgi:hypothetical protein